MSDRALSCVAVECMTSLLRVQQMSGSNLCQETDYSDWGFSWIASVSPGKLPNRRPRPLPIIPF
jgi:hypothetical protein